MLHIHLHKFTHQGNNNRLNFHQILLQTHNFHLHNNLMKFKPQKHSSKSICMSNFLKNKQLPLFQVHILRHYSPLDPQTKLEF